MSTTDQQIRAIRMAIKSLEKERYIVSQKPETAATLEDLLYIDVDIRSLQDAITALRNADTFRNSLKSFLG